MIRSELVDTVIRLAARGTAIPKIRRLLVGLALVGDLDGDAPVEAPDKVLARFAEARDSAIKSGKLKLASPPSQIGRAPRRWITKFPVERLGNLAVLRKGETGIQNAKPGPYPLVVTAEGRGSCDHFDFEGPAAIVPLVSSTGHGHASIQRLHYQEGRFALGNILCAILPLVPDQLSARFLYEYLTAYKQELLVSSMVGTANVSLTLAKVAEVPVVLVSTGAQRRLDQLMALLDNLEAKQGKQQRTVVRATTACLDALSTADGHEAVADAWKRVAGNWRVLFNRPETVGDLRKTVLELAVRGRLVRPLAAAPSLDALLRQVGGQRAEMIAGRRMGARGNGDQEDTAPAEPFGIPEHWRWCNLSDLAGHIVDGTHHTPKYVERGMDFISAKDIRGGKISFEGCRQISRSEYEELGKRCQPRLGNVLVTKSGSIGEVAVVEADRPFTLFESVALIPVVPCLNSRYVALAVYLRASGDFGDANRKGVGVHHLHLVDLRRLPVPLPPREEQDRIVAKVDQLMALCDDLEAKLLHRDDRAGKLVEAVIGEIVGADRRGDLVPTEAELARAEGRSYETAEEMLARVKGSAAVASARSRKRRSSRDKGVSA